MPPMPGNNNRDGLEKVLNDLVQQVKDLAEKVGVLGTNQKEVLDASRRGKVDQKALYQTVRSMNPGMTDDEVRDLVEMQTRRIDQGGAGFSGIYNRLMTAQFPSGEEAVSLLGYGQTFGRGRIARAYGLGALIQQAFSPQQGISRKELGVSQSELDQILGLGRTDRGNVNRARALDPSVEAALRTVDVSGSSQVRTAYEKLFGDNPVTSPKAIANNRQILMDALLNQGGSGFAALAESENPLVRGLANRGAALANGRVGGAMFRAGGQIMMGARALAGPISAAVTAGQAAYSAINTLYDPARSAAGLGYGFSANPFSEGARVSMGRSLQTRLSALSFGLSGQQTAAARAAVEGMGLGGPGQEGAYNQYYRSMTDVMQETQLDANILAPFYEQFMRQGGGADEVQQLTKMLSVDLPKAAAASRMSLQGMAEMIQRTTQAVAANPFAAAGRTEAEISQTLMSAAQSGGPPGMQAIAGGTNPLVVAQTAARLGTGYFTAAQEAGQLQATTVDILRRFLGDMSPEEFEAYRKTEQGAIQIMTVGAMTGLSNTDIQKVYDIGLDDYAASSVLGEKFAEGNLSEAKKEIKDKTAYDVYSAIGGVFGIEPDKSKFGEVTTSQTIKGTGFDLYAQSGADLRRMYGEDIKAMESALANMGGDELKNFQDKLAELQDQKAIETWKLLQDTSRKISGEATRDEKVEGLIDLSDEAKRYFKLEFSSGSPSDYPPNNNTNLGGTRVG